MKWKRPGILTCLSAIPTVGVLVVAAFGHPEVLVLALLAAFLPVALYLLECAESARSIPEPPVTPRIERVARAMCVADGLNPDADGSRRTYSDGAPGRYAWQLYTSRAQMFCAALDTEAKG